ncbi:MAG: outer membrane lipoprotein carrier protein LolA [Bacilli bacterium]|nr:outer membrane lipoprotein carrier protein LolA [Bacilli bacterium]CDE95336.1 putative lipoprotein [Clostridium sp. CAG:914]
MKKIFLGIFLCLIFLTGCGKKSEGDVLKSYTSAVEKAKSYYLNGKMELVNNEDVYTYDISVSYEADDNYKIELVNTVNNHEQVILRNSEGVYVVTPSLNKSFKFQSDWPYNNSQVYLLSSLLDDINNDEERVFETKDNEYVFTTRVNYPNSPKLEKQKIYFNANNLPTRVEVLDKDGNVEIKMVFNKIDLKADFNDTYFDLSSILDTEVKEEKNEEQQNTETETKETATIDDIIYPMYLPTNTYLANQEKVKVDNGERLILTFAGDSSFVLVEETVSITNSPEIIPTYGEVELIGASLAVINDNSANWFSNGIEYYVVSDTMDSSEILEVAKSISVLPVGK